MWDVRFLPWRSLGVSVAGLHLSIGLWQVQASMLDDLLIFSVWLFVVVASLLAGREGRRPSFTVLGWAAMAGFVGLVGGFFVAMNRAGSYIGGANFAAWKVGTLCAGIGWAGGWGGRLPRSSASS
jgi:hypothetical protein